MTRQTRLGQPGVTETARLIVVVDHTCIAIGAMVRCIHLKVNLPMLAHLAHRDRAAGASVVKIYRTPAHDGARVSNLRIGRVISLSTGISQKASAVRCRVRTTGTNGITQQICRSVHRYKLTDSEGV